MEPLKNSCHIAATVLAPLSTYYRTLEAPTEGKGCKDSPTNCESMEVIASLWKANGLWLTIGPFCLVYTVVFGLHSL